jgi:antagonist of KipI
MSLRIIKPGILDTIQDQGRYGYQHLGINPGGVMDGFSSSLANALLGKKLNTPVIEMHFPAAEISIEKPCILSMTCGDFSPLINGAAAPLYQPVVVPANSTLRFTGWKSGARCYLSLLNNLHLTAWLNSYSTNMKATAGGYRGRKLQKGDEISFNLIDSLLPLDNFLLLPWQYRSDEAEKAVHFIPGPEWNWLTEKSRMDFLETPFVIGSSSDRMGYRLQGKVLHPVQEDQLLSTAVCFGTVQLLPNGQLIVLMADHQTTGGYPRIAHIISTHLPKLAQLNPGDELIFEETTVEAAQAKLITQQNYLMQLQKTCNLKMQNWLHAH